MSNRDQHAKGPLPLLIVLLLVPLALPIGAQQSSAEGNEKGKEEEAASSDIRDPDVDTSQWRCRLCPFETGWRGSVSFGPGYVSDDSFEFGDYTGLNDDGVYIVADGELRYRGEDAEFWSVTATDLGLGSRSVTTEGGRQGRYRVSVEYRELPHLIADDARTVFSGAGSQRLELPDDWARGDTTTEMPQLDSSLRDENIAQDRETIRIGAEVTQNDRLRYDVSYRRSTKKGSRIQGGNFLLRSALLPVPVDYRTEEVDASVSYIEDRWQIEAAYHGSFFHNEADSVAWDNPFSTPGTDGEKGRLALAPDNHFNQLMLSASWRPVDYVHSSARIALGRMEQNDDFLPATINESLASPALPRDDLDARVDTRVANLRVTATPWPALTAQGELYYDERDNKTPRDEYVQVSSDLVVGGIRENRPYGFRKIGGELEADYRLSDVLTASAGGGRERMERTFQEVDETETDTVWGEVRATPGDSVDFRVRQTLERRDLLDDYEPLDLQPPENPALRKYNLAARDRDMTTITANFTPADRLSVGVTLDRSNDEYGDSEIGLTDADDTSVTLDISTVPTDGMTAYGFLSHQRIDSELQGSDTADEPNWRADFRDTIRSAGVGMKFNDLFTEGFDAGIDYTYTWARGDIDMDKRTTTTSFPNLDSRLHSFQLFGDYRISESTAVRLDYWYEQYRSDDFFIDDVEPDTIPAVLTLGRESPDYDVHVVALTFRYRF
ncbi:MtrB/PioB family decaheme-associated outer membrane protein [Arhodomonas sp. AD133]|uniref:MtrB/PioB family decaheme-associated outer membrane protein n=1 Tax=Arhodomonas sp. AD133 TaxID=3415009 RepID=UPI003EBB0961